MFIPVPHYANLNTQYISIDDKERFVTNCKTLPKEWRWHTESIIYKTNQFGYRTVEPKDIKWVLNKLSNFTDK